MIGPISFKCSQIFNPVKMIHHPQKKLVKSWNYNWISRIFLLALPFFERSLFFLIRLYIRWNTIVYTMLSSSRRMQLKKKKTAQKCIEHRSFGAQYLKRLSSLSSLLECHQIMDLFKYQLLKGRGNGQ